MKYAFIAIVAFSLVGCAGLPKPTTPIGGEPVEVETEQGQKITIQVTVEVEPKSAK